MKMGSLLKTLIKETPGPNAGRGPSSPLAVDLSAVKARLKSIPVSKMESLPHAVQKLLVIDMPRLIRALEEERGKN